MTDTTTALVDRERPPADLNAPWTLAFDRDGTEDFGVIFDADDREIVSSQHCRTCWLPEDEADDVPALVRQLRVMAAAPLLLAALRDVLPFAREAAGWANLRNDGSAGDAAVARAEAVLAAADGPAA